MTATEPVSTTTTGGQEARSVLEHEALCALLQAAQRADVEAVGSIRRVAFRNTRSLLGAADELGFTRAALAAILEVTEGSVRLRTGPPLPILPSAFLALIPDATGSRWTAGIRDSGRGSEREIDVVVLLRWYLLQTGGPDGA